MESLVAEPHKSLKKSSIKSFFFFSKCIYGVADVFGGTAQETAALPGALAWVKKREKSRLLKGEQEPRESPFAGLGWDEGGVIVILEAAPPSWPLTPHWELR